jgi:FkbM family methyltransferase
MAHAFPSMQRVSVPYGGTSICLDLRRVDHQAMFLDGVIFYESEEQKLVEQLVPSGGTAIDVGANVGLYTITLARLVGPKGRVISYEPEADNLIANTARLVQVTVRCAVVSEVEGLVSFRHHRSSSLSRVISKSEAIGRDLQVASVTLDAEVSRLGLGGIDFLKIDTEGSEGDVFAGARRLLSEASAPVILFEWIPGFRNRWNRSALAVLKETAGPDWRLFRVGWNRPMMEIYGFEEPTVEANIFAFPPARSLALRQFLECASNRASAINEK